VIEIEVDELRCVGGGQCVMVAPDLFDQRDEDGVVILLEATPSEDREDAARRAELVCPAAAIRVRARA
jgi:ferredoxin